MGGYWISFYHRYVQGLLNSEKCEREWVRLEGRVEVGVGEIWMRKFKNQKVNCETDE